MRSFALALTLFFLSSYTQAAPAASYSVIDVDGGNGGRQSGIVVVPTTIFATITASAMPTTVSVTVTKQETLTSTISVVSTVTTTKIESLATTIYATADHTVTIQNSQAPTTPSATVTTTTETQIATTTFESVQLTTFQAVVSSTSTTYYDNGFWHTSYPVKPWTTETPSLPAVSSTQTSQLGTSTTIASASMLYRRAGFNRRG